MGHAGAGMFWSFSGPSIMLPISCTPNVHEFFRSVGRYFQWQMEVLPICLWVMVIWEVDLDKLGLTDKLVEVVMEEAKACGTVSRWSMLAI